MPTKSSSCSTGSGVRLPSDDALRGNVEKASAARSAVNGSSDQKAARQVANSANMPPTAGPISVAVPQVAEIRPMARVQSTGAKTRRMTP
ncbi:hypothetical protein D3C87_1682970 [compost metagenome]